MNPVTLQPLNDLLSRQSSHQQNSLLNACYDQEARIIRAEKYNTLAFTHDLYVSLTNSSAPKADFDFLIEEANKRLCQLYRRIHRTIQRSVKFPLIVRKLDLQLQSVDYLIERFEAGYIEQEWQGTQVRVKKCLCFNPAEEARSHKLNPDYTPILYPWDVRNYHVPTCPWVTYY